MTVDESSQASESDQKTTSVCGYPRTSEADGADRASKRRKMEQSVEDDTSRHEEVEDSLTIKSRRESEMSTDEPSTLIEGVLDVELAGTDAHQIGQQAVTSQMGSTADRPGPSKKVEEPWELRMTWNGKQFDLRIEGDDCVYDVKAIIFSLTSVPINRQKLIGLSKIRSPEDDIRFKDLGVPKRHKFTCIGTPEEDTFKDPSKLRSLPDLLDSFDVAYDEPGAPTPAEDPRNQRLIKKKVEQCVIDVMNPLRPGKKLLVLDLDYTIVDTKPLLSGSLPPSECIRPGLHEFLERCYAEYDIAVWSQTHWRWLESKLVEMGMIGDEARKYRIAFVADMTSMFPVFGVRDGKTYKHDVKPLAFLWTKFPQYSSRNTIHIDDLGRNFALNPGEGLKIRAFKGAGTEDGMQDDQLHKLGAYLMAIAKIDDLTKVDHSQWKKFIKKKAKEAKDVGDAPAGATAEP